MYFPDPPEPVQSMSRWHRYRTLLRAFVSVYPFLQFATQSLFGV